VTRELDLESERELGRIWIVIHLDPHGRDATRPPGGNLRDASSAHHSLNAGVGQNVDRRRAVVAEHVL
jgi:hypothetical protein